MLCPREPGPEAIFPLFPHLVREAGHDSPQFCGKIKLDLFLTPQTRLRWRRIKDLPMGMRPRTGKGYLCWVTADLKAQSLPAGRSAAPQPQRGLLPWGLSHTPTEGAAPAAGQVQSTRGATCFQACVSARFSTACGPKATLSSWLPGASHTAASFLRRPCQQSKGHDLL